MQSPSIVSLDVNDKAQLRAVAEFHAKLLPDSLIPRLGPLFMRKFYYDKLVRDGLIYCDLYRHEGKYVAFLTYTKYPFTWMKRGKERHLFYLAGILFLSICAKPSRLLLMLETLSQGGRRAQNTDDGKVAEALSIGVLPEAASVKDPVAGCRIAESMMRHSLDFFSRSGFKEVLLMINRKNTSSLLFFKSMGAVKKEADFIPATCRLMSLPLVQGVKSE